MLLRVWFFLCSSAEECWCLFIACLQPCNFRNIITQKYHALTNNKNTTPKNTQRNHWDLFYLLSYHCSSISVGISNSEVKSVKVLMYPKCNCKVVYWYHSLASDSPLNFFFCVTWCMCDHPSCCKVKQTTKPSPTFSSANQLDTGNKGVIFTFPSCRSNLFWNLSLHFASCILFPWRQYSFNPPRLTASHSAGLF